MDLKRRLEAERDGVPFVFLRDGEGTQRIVALDPGLDYLTVGRDETCDLCLHWDEKVSRLHARLERSGALWTIYDGGLSRNGTFLNGERVTGRRLLNNGDELRFGTTDVGFRDPTPRAARTKILPEELAAVSVSPAQRRVLVALCRPYKNHPAFARPASNRDVATELFLSIESVKSHLRALFSKFNLDELPQNEKRVRLVEQAFQHGLVRDDEL